MLRPADLDHWAESLHHAWVTSTPIAPVSASIPGLTVADSYAIQKGLLARRTAAGATLVGHKIGLTSPPMQQLLGVDQPDYGFIVDDMVVEDGGTLVVSELCAPRVEPEIAFRLHLPLRGPGVTAADVLAATDAVAPALEIVDSRIEDWRITLTDTVADNASSAAVVLGPWVPIADVPDLAQVTADLVVNDATVDTGSGAAVLGHPATAVAWLANALASFDIHLGAGQFVMSGSITSAVFVHPGDRASTELSGLGRVGVSFS